jgi:hypothetical protein
MYEDLSVQVTDVNSAFTQSIGSQEIHPVLVDPSVMHVRELTYGCSFEHNNIKIQCRASYAGSYHNYWLTEEELEEKRRDLQWEKTIREATLQRINPQPHEARLQRDKSPQTESNP